MERKILNIKIWLKTATVEWSLNLFVGFDSVRACNRPRQPCLWFEGRYANLSNDKATIKNWMRNQKKASGFGKDLITDINCVTGWEADFVIYLGLRDVDEFAFMSRCRGQFVQIE